MPWAMPITWRELTAVCRVLARRADEQRRRRVDGVDEREVDDVPVGEGTGRAAVEVEGAHGLVPVRDRDGEQRADTQVGGARAPRRVAGVGADVTAAQPSAGVGDLDAGTLT